MQSQEDPLFIECLFQYMHTNGVKIVYVILKITFLEKVNNALFYFYYLKITSCGTILFWNFVLCKALSIFFRFLTT